MVAIWAGMVYEGFRFDGIRKCGRMDGLVKDVIPLLQYLTSGFLTAWIFYALTSFKKPDTFGQIVQALVFTFVIHILLTCVEKACVWVGSYGFTLGRWDDTAKSLWSLIISVSLGFLSCGLAYSDHLHKWLRKSGFSARTSYPSEWHSIFIKHKRFVVLNLVDERRIYGWPLEWPSDPTCGQFALYEPSWVDDTGEEIPMDAEVFLIDASKVEWVEFTPKTW